MEEKITYFSFSDAAGQIKILVKDTDADRMKQALMDLSDRYGVYPDPQITLAALFEGRFSDKKEMTYKIPDLDSIGAVKYDAYRQGFRFALDMSENGSYRLVYAAEDQDKADAMHLTERFGAPAPLFNRMSLRDCKDNLQNIKKQKEAENEHEQGRKKGHGRDEKGTSR